jgi:hypothetical protein
LTSTPADPAIPNDRARVSAAPGRQRGARQHDHRPTRREQAGHDRGKARVELVDRLAGLGEQPPRRIGYHNLRMPAILRRPARDLQRVYRSPDQVRKLPERLAEPLASMSASLPAHALQAAEALLHDTVQLAQTHRC